MVLLVTKNTERKQNSISVRGHWSEMDRKLINPRQRKAKSSQVRQQPELVTDSHDWSRMGLSGIQ